MKRLLVLGFTLNFFSLSNIYSSPPENPCRVKPRVMIKYSAEQIKQIVNEKAKQTNAGCVITRGEGENLEFLMVEVKKDLGKWGFPGGGSASQSEEKKYELDEADPKADQVKYVRLGKAARAFKFEKEEKLGKEPTKKEIEIHNQYVEPVYCTAAREGHEETGLDLVVTEYITDGPYFWAFECQRLDPKQAVKPKDRSEVNAHKWFTLQAIKDNIDAAKKVNKKFLRFDNNLHIAEAAAKMIQKR